jgi:hypothetical protein
MKLVWKCDHCSQTNADKDKIEKHEVSCIFNPSNRHCYTCDNHYDEYGSDYCKIYNDYRGLTPLPTNDFDKFYDVLDKYIKCRDWVSEKVRIKEMTKKLIKLKDVIEKSKTI